MAKKKPSNKKSPLPVPTGLAKPAGSALQHSTPVSPAAVEAPEVPVSDSLNNVAHARSQAPGAQFHLSDAPLASQTESPLSETLATVIPDVAVPSSPAADAATSSGPLHQPATPQNHQEKVEPNPAEIWKTFVKDSVIKLKPRETPFLLDSGEACVTIPNAVVERNKKAWDSFILGQFYEDPPPKGAVHAIVNGIWSRERRDITVSKMDGNAFLFRVPCPHARRRILSQSIWQIDGQTMFVAKWSPGLQQEKPQLSMVPVWLDFTGVPLQFFNREALQEIAGIVGHPVCLHPATENLTNIEVAKVYTVIDPRKPIPKFVNARFENGAVRRIGVSSSWLPSLCSYCNQVGHTVSRCKAAPRTCSTCNSAKHDTSHCPRTNPARRKGKEPIKSLLPIVPQPQKVYRPMTGVGNSSQKSAPSVSVQKVPVLPSSETLTPSRNKGKSQECTPANTVVKEYDLESLRGTLCVDLTPTVVSPTGSSNSPCDQEISDPDSFSNEDDYPDDEFIEVISRRAKRNSKRSRVRGPLSL